MWCHVIMCGDARFRVFLNCGIASIRRKKHGEKWERLRNCKYVAQDDYVESTTYERLSRL